MLRLGQPSAHKEGLYDTFQQLLAEQNIVLEFEDDFSQNDVEDIQSDSGADVLQAGFGQEENNGRPSRRASFTSLYDTTKELARVTPPRASSRSSVSRLGLDRRKMKASHTFREPRNSKRASQKSQSEHVRPIGLEFLGRRSTGHSRGAKGIHAEMHRPRRHHSRSDAQSPGASHHVPQVRLSEAEMVKVANSFNEYRLEGLLRSFLARWNSEAHHVHFDNAAMEQQAIVQDRRTLSRQAFDIWRTTSQQKRHKEQTERIFEQLYSRAGKARNLYLLTKAFSHWRVVSAEETARTGVARRHILRMKYFNAWKDITVINELKAQRQGLRRPFNLLRHRLAQICTNEVNAISLYHHNLTRSVFFRWFWSFCEGAVPRYRQTQIQSRTFQTWIDKSKRRAQQERQAESFFMQSKLRKITTKWATAARIDIGGYHQADGFLRGRLLRPLIERWQNEAKLAPLAARVSNMRDWRVARTYFSVWVMRNRMMQRAEEVDQLRLKRNTWTTWNDQLRIRALETRINDRLVAQAVYKWVLQERCILMNRVHERSVKRRAFATFLDNARTRLTALEQCDSKLRQNQNVKISSLALQCWKLQMRLFQEKETMAREYWAPRVEQDAVSALRLKIKTVQKYNNWAGDAYFYFSTTKVLQRWKGAALEAQKKRRQAAYGAIRRLVKINLAKKVLASWHGKLGQLGSLKQRAQDFVDAQFREEISLVFTVWKVTAAKRIEDAEQAAMSYQSRVLRSSLSSWQDAAHGYQTLEGRAEHFHHIHISEVCSSQLRKLSLKAFEIRCRDQAADATRVRHFDKHLRKMFRHWNDRTRDKMLDDLNEAATALDVPPPEGQQHEQPSSLEGPINLTGSEFDVRQAEEWTAFDDILDNGNIHQNNNEEDWIPPLDEAQMTISPPAAATPGYLNTPSKRAVRARALANLSTTPAGMPQVRTPFSVRLRGERDARTSGTTERDRTARRVMFEDTTR